MKLSIIIPVYNAEKYLHNCIESVLNQSILDYEVILVDDGSTDNSLSICEGYCESDKRVHVIHQENKGVSAARNVGLNYAGGEYIGFIDADDEATKKMYEQMISLADKTNSDIVICDVMSIFPDGRLVEDDTITDLPESTVLYRHDLSVSILKEMAGAVWRCIYRTSFLKEHCIEFPVGLKISEDRIFNLYAMGYASKIAYVKEPLYFRTLNDESAVHRYHADYPAIVERGRVATVTAIEQAWGNNPEFQNCYKRQYVEGCLNAIENEKRIDAHHSFWRRYLAIRSICSNPKLTEAIASTNYQKENLKCRWILQKRYFILSLRNQKIFRKADSIMSQIRKDGICAYIRRLAGKVFKWQ